MLPYNLYCATKLSYSISRSRSLFQPNLDKITANSQLCPELIKLTDCVPDIFRLHYSRKENLDPS